MGRALNIRVPFYEGLMPDPRTQQQPGGAGGLGGSRQCVWSDVAFLPLMEDGKGLRPTHAYTCTYTHILLKSQMPQFTLTV